MNKLFKIWSINLLLLIFICTFSGCIDVEMKINNNGSSEIKYTIIKNNALTVQNIKDEINKQINKINLRNNKKVAQLKNITIKEDHIEAVVNFSDLSLVDQNISHQSIKKWLKNNQTTTVINVKNGQSESINKINKNYQIISINGFGIYSINSLKIIIPGEITHLSKNCSLIEKNRAELKAGIGILIYKKPSFAVKIFFILVLVIFILLLKAIHQKGSNRFIRNKQPKA